MNYQQTSFRRAVFRSLLYISILIFVFDFDFYRYGFDIRLGSFMHNVVANLEREAKQNFDHWRVAL